MATTAGSIAAYSRARSHREMPAALGASGIGALSARGLVLVSPHVLSDCASTALIRIVVPFAQGRRSRDEAGSAAAEPGVPWRHQGLREAVAAKSSKSVLADTE